MQYFMKINGTAKLQRLSANYTPALASVHMYSYESKYHGTRLTLVKQNRETDKLIFKASFLNGERQRRTKHE